MDAALLAGLRCFEAAGRLLSFTKAAQALNLTQSAVSQQIRHLEDRLGYLLFVRLHRGLRLTTQGVALLECTTRVFADLQRTLTTLASPDTPLLVSCLPSFALQWLMPRLVEFHRIEPSVTVRLKAEFQTLDLQAMSSDAIDVAIRFDPRHYQDLTATLLLDEFIVPVATPQYLAEHALFAAGRSRRGVTLLHDAAPWDGAPAHIEWRTWIEATKASWIKPLDGVAFNLASLAIGAALNHQGVAMARTALVVEEVRTGRLVPALGRAVPAPARYVVLTRASKDRRVERFVAWLRSECERFSEARNRLFGA